MENSVSFLNTVHIRSETELLSKVDLYYCLDWYCANQNLNDKSVGTLNPFIIEERRRALEWIADVNFDWDTGSLDT